MKFKTKQLSKRVFALFLAITLMAGTGVTAFAKEQTGTDALMPETERSVSENDEKNTADADKEEKEIDSEEKDKEEKEKDEKEGFKPGKEGEDPLETYNGIPTEWLEDDGEYVYSEEAGSYVTEDAFAKTSTKKGVQGDFNGADYIGSYGGQHTLLNLRVTDFMGDGSIHTDKRFDYNGRTYYFRDTFSTLIRSANAKGATVSMTILVPYQSNKEILIDSTALANRGNNTKNSPYYAPNVRGEGRHYYEALFAWMAENWCKADCHVDNFILGNEVNMPNSWCFSGSSDPQYNVDLYTDAYMILYNAIRSKTSVSRVSVSLDHSWQHNDEGRGIATKDYLDRFNAAISARQANVDWSISYHLYPTILSQPDIWVELAHMPDAPEIDLNPKRADAQFVDGNNLSIMTDYVKNTFGPQHRILLTEQGFSQYMGTGIQAASLAYSYYAAKYDPMVDCFIINQANEGGKLNFSIGGVLAGDVFARLDSDPAWVESQTLPVIGVSSYSEIVPGYGRVVNRAQVEAFVTRLYEMCLKRQPDESGLADWTNKLCNGQISGAEAARGFFLSDEIKLWNLTNEEYVELLYNVMMGRASDAGGKADWVYKLNNGVGREGVYRGFAESTEFGNICNDYGIIRGSIKVDGLEGRDKNPGLTTFVARLYTKALGREYEVDGLNDWCNRITSGQWSINDVSTTGFFTSPEFLAKNLSNDEYVKVLYRTFFDREYDQAGYDDWMNRLAKGTSRNEVMLGFANSREFAELKASFGLR